MICTSYTRKLIEEGQTLNEFVWTCARGVGFLGHMRDTGFDAKIVYRKVSPYLEEQIRELKKELEGLLKITPEEWLSKQQPSTYLERHEEYTLHSSRLEVMKGLVQRLVFPQQLRGLKEFMLKQIGECKQFEPSKEQELTVADFYKELEGLSSDISYYNRCLEKEIESVNETNKYIDMLNEIVPIPKNLNGLKK